jgi:hypothetical protein
MKKIKKREIKIKIEKKTKHLQVGRMWLKIKGLKLMCVPCPMSHIQSMKEGKYLVTH